VFGICVLSSLVQGSLMPVGAKRWDMLDPSDTVLKTFNYYLDKANLGFFETRIKKGGKHVGTKVKDLNMEFDFIVAKIERDGKTIVPRGEVIFEEDDIVVLSGETHFDKSGQNLIEFTIPENHEWAGAYIRDLHPSHDRLIITVQRKGSDLIFPDGNTQLLAHDKVVLLELEKPDELIDAEPL
ncbi:MAG: TrkA C-terminal domain-containing protein, partial [Eubacteriales bacterium]|nr:TrkA C-terminal domain-containing protein [Eubacteriales bacterium]